jgi:hypothetical protein
MSATKVLVGQIGYRSPAASLNHGLVAREALIGQQLLGGHHEFV